MVPVTSFAQNVSNEEPTQTVVVSATRDAGSLVSPSAATARRAIRQTPGGVDVIDAEEVKTGRATTPQDLFGYSPGVFVQQRDTGAQESRVSIRGSGLQRTFHLRGIKVLQDGIPLNQADGSGDMQRVEPLAVKYTEVFRGGNALRYGASTLGGAINLVSPTGHDAAPFQFRLQRGSFDNFHGQLATSGVDGKFDHYLSLSAFKQDGFRDHTQQDNMYGTANVGWKIDDEWETRLYVTAENANAQLGGSLTKAQMLANPRQARLGNVTGDNRRDFEYFRVASKTTWHRGTDRVDISAYHFGIDLFHPIFQVLDVDSHDTGGEVRYTSTAPLAGHPNTFLIGFMPQTGTQSDDRFTNVGGRRGARTGQLVQDAYTLDLYAEDVFEVDSRLSIVPGVQISKTQRKTRDFFFPNGDDSGAVRQGSVSPKLGALFALTPHAQAFGGYTRGFEPPSFAELTSQAGDFLGNRAQRSDTWEIGVRGDGNRGTYDVTFYDSRIKDELLSLNDAQGFPLGTINARTPTTHRGVELGGRLKVYDAGKQGTVNARGIYNWSHFRFRDDPVYRDNQLPGFPEHFARADLTWQHPSGIYAGPNIERVFSRYAVDQANTFFADPYTIWGFRAGYQAAKGVSGFIDGKNLSNRTYAASTGIVNDALGRDSNQVFNPGNGRSVYAGMELKY